MTFYGIFEVLLNKESLLQYKEVKKQNMCNKMVNRADVSDGTCHFKTIISNLLFHVRLYRMYAITNNLYKINALIGGLQGKMS